MTNTNAIFGDEFGRLGNQLFQYGLLFAIRERSGHDFHLARRDAALWRCFDLDVAATGTDCRQDFHERNGSCNFDGRVFEQPADTSFHGFFQSYRYLEGCADELRRALRFHNVHRARAEALLFAVRRRHRRPLVAVHVRRQDYVAPGFADHWGDLAADGYYQRAIDAIGRDVTFLVFSDHIDWCREHLAIERAEYVDADTETSLCMMSRCDANVIANSTFSWWGAWLNPAADVYAPSRWFGRDMPAPNDRQDDIVPPTWRTIPVHWDQAGPDDERARASASRALTE